MHKRYFRKKTPICNAESIEWVEMSGKEYYSFVTAPENKGRYFIDMGDVVLECTKGEYKKFKSEDDHSTYILAQEAGWTTQSLESIVRDSGLCGEEIIADTAQCVEETAIFNLIKQMLVQALHSLHESDLKLIEELYLKEQRKTLRQLSVETGIPIMTLQDRKKKVLSILRLKMFVEKN